MPVSKNAKGVKFPFEFKRNGRIGRIKKWRGGRFGTGFSYGGRYIRNCFTSFAAAYEYLDREFSKLDTKAADSVALNPIRNDVKTYSELELLLREKGNGATLREAVEFYLAHAKTKQFTPKSVTECIDLFLAASKENNLSALSLKTYQKHLRQFERGFAQRQIHEVTTLEISNWLKAQKTKLSGQKWTANTRTKVRGSLVSLSIFCQKELKAIPDFGDTEFQNVKAPKKEERAEVEIYSPDQLSKLMVAAIENDFDLIPALAAGCFAGLRPFEFHAEGLARAPLTWEAFNWQDNILHVKGQKIRSKATRHIPIQKSFIAWMEPFGGLKGEIWRRTKAYDFRMRKLFAKAGVMAIRDGFRHSYASYRIRQLKGGLVELAAEMGNSPAEIIDSYKRNITDAQAGAWFSIMPPPEYVEIVSAAIHLRQTA